MLTVRDGKYFLVGDYLGAYEIRNGLMLPLTEAGGVSTQVRGKPVQEFRDEIGEMLRKLGR